jgi:hypothetical protein
MRSLTCWLTGCETRKERRGDTLELVCNRCETRTPAIARSARERTAMRRKFRTPHVLKAQPVKSADVLTMPRKQRG